MKKAWLGLLIVCSVFLVGCSLIQKTDNDLNSKITDLESGLNNLLIQNQQLIEENNFLNGKLNQLLNNSGSISEISDTNNELKYVVKNKKVGDGNGEQIDVYLDGKLIFSKSPVNGLGFFYKLVGNVIFIDYGTSVGGRTIKLFDLNNGRLIFETRYNGNLRIDSTAMYFNFSFYPNPDGVVCDNYDEIANMGGSVNYEQKRSYNFNINKLINLGEIYCAYGE